MVLMKKNKWVKFSKELSWKKGKNTVLNIIKLHNPSGYGDFYYSVLTDSNGSRVLRGSQKNGKFAAVAFAKRWMVRN